jgi:hypothetical protein
MKNRLQAFAFKWANVYRYTAVRPAAMRARATVKTTTQGFAADAAAGLCRLNQVDP